MHACMHARCKHAKCAMFKNMQLLKNLIYLQFLQCLMFLTMTVLQSVYKGEFVWCVCLFEWEHVIYIYLYDLIKNNIKSAKENVEWRCCKFWTHFEKQWSIATSPQYEKSNNDPKCTEKYWTYRKSLQHSSFYLSIYKMGNKNQLPGAQDNSYPSHFPYLILGLLTWNMETWMYVCACVF